MYPILFTIENFKVYTWDFINLLGFFVTVGVAIVLKPEDFVLTRRQIALSGLILIIFGFLGARLLHIILYFKQYQGVPLLKVLSQRGGFAYIGGPILGLSALWVYLRPKKIGFLEVADYISPFVALGHAISRIGCFLNGCCYGIPTDLPWAVVFQGDTIPRHPTQLYSSFALFLIFLITRCNYARWRAKFGLVFYMTVLLYGSYRFFLEFLRTDSPHLIGFITLSQIASLVIILIGVAGIYFSNKKWPGFNALKVYLGKRYNLITTSLFLTCLLAMLLFYLISL